MATLQESRSVLSAMGTVAQLGIATNARDPDEHRKTNSALQPTALTVGAVKVPSVGFARSGGG